MRHRIYFGDNLPVLRNLSSESVDLTWPVEVRAVTLAPAIPSPLMSMIEPSKDRWSRSSAGEKVTNEKHKKRRKTVLIGMGYLTEVA